ncbi:hypothetical protein HYPBUDRAFT_4837 [Hyphopichia burtonii NRRL Y-1933]|uniref:Uncharacterized protein n=1 Tax=Hyphopichia burtonii NRRL Y-1933 TaxID=984485 RepID=A0A1E4RNI9_9ASCO|nr:hypothetical protein HYPBUDRAFT_4837 [Hyphopichia burtonii NRRL Y-1933]ODV68761.1 hypothetical protein HYPBUDRAFT_4837 [Hyphopichia burtonii NRRL Y-1933]
MSLKSVNYQKSRSNHSSLNGCASSKGVKRSISKTSLNSTLLSSPTNSTSGKMKSNMMFQEDITSLEVKYADYGEQTSARNAMIDFDRLNDTSSSSPISSPVCTSTSLGFWKGDTSGPLENTLQSKGSFSPRIKPPRVPSVVSMSAADKRPLFLRITKRKTSSIPATPLQDSFPPSESGSAKLKQRIGSFSTHKSIDDVSSMISVDSIYLTVSTVVDRTKGRMKSFIKKTSRLLTDKTRASYDNDSGAIGVSHGASLKESIGCNSNLDANSQIHTQHVLVHQTSRNSLKALQDDWPYGTRAPASSHTAAPLEKQSPISSITKQTSLRNLKSQWSFPSLSSTEDPEQFDLLRRLEMFGISQKSRPQQATTVDIN